MRYLPASLPSAYLKKVPMPLQKNSQYEGTLCLFAPAASVHPAHNHRPDSVLDDTLSRRPWAPLVAGAAAGIIGWTVTFPFDVLKTRLQASTITGDTLTSARPRTDIGLGLLWRTARKMYTESGGRAFYRGLAPTLVRAVPVNMAVFGTFEGVVWGFSRT